MNAASVEQINKLRASMGMKPLPVPGASNTQPAKPGEEEDVPSTLESRQAQAAENYKKLRAEQDAKKRREERAAAIKKAREREQLHQALEGKGLGDLDDGPKENVKSWLKKRPKRQKEIERREQEEAAKAKVAAAVHTASDLAGVNVAHDLADFADGSEQILTLKDVGVLENEAEGDELENLELREEEKLNENLRLKKKRPIYDPNDIDETGERSILAQYDEEIQGKKEKRFTLDDRGVTHDLDDILAAPPPEKQKRVQTSLDDVLEDAPPSSDYLDIKDVKIKKLKKKKLKATRQRLPNDADDDFGASDPTTAADMMDIDSGSSCKPKRSLDVDDDDNDLQSLLATQRNDALRKRKKTRLTDLAKRLREDSYDNVEAEGEERGGGGGLVIDEITEFVDTIKKSSENIDTKPSRKHVTAARERATPTHDAPTEAAADGDVDMDEAGGADHDEARVRETSPTNELTTTGIEEEKTVAQGLGATLSLLRERGLIQDGQGAKLNEKLREKQHFLAERAARLARLEEEARRQREQDRASGRLDRMSARDREEWQRRQNTDRDRQASLVMQDLFKSYKPNVELKYTDEFGRSLDAKEAFKELSHQFHGKASGKQKTDKRLHKISEEKRREARSILDASENVGMSLAQAQQTKKRKEAGVRLA